MTKAADLPDIKNSNELIVYQIGDLKALFMGKVAKDDAYFAKTDQRISALELWQAGEVEKSKSAPMDVQRIILTSLGVASAGIAFALVAIQSGFIHK